jgi:hypothetical protein
MIPEWREAIQQALKIQIKRLCHQRLDIFHPDSEVPAYLNQLAETNAGTLSLEHLAGRYALRAHFCKAL